MSGAGKLELKEEEIYTKHYFILFNCQELYQARDKLYPFVSSFSYINIGISPATH